MRTLVAIAALGILACSAPITRVGAAGCANEPAGFVTVTNWPFTTVTGGGWTGGSKDISAVEDPDEPLSPPGAAEFRFPIGFSSRGIGPGEVNYAFDPGKVRELYVCFSFKSSKPWQSHESNVNKIFYLFTRAGDHLVPVMYGPPGFSWSLRWAPQFTKTPNWNWLDGSGDLRAGRWYVVEMHLQPSRTSSSDDGTFLWWIDGTRAGRATLSTPADAWDGLSLNPTWGGVGGPDKQQNDFFRFGHVRVSVPMPAQSSSASAGQAPTSLAAPATAAARWSDPALPTVTIAGQLILLEVTGSVKAGDAPVVGVTATVDGGPATVAWSSGAASYTVTAKVTAGSHTVEVTVTDAKGRKVTTSRTVTAP
jgi:hypothetical protein